MPRVAKAKMPCIQSQRMKNKCKKKREQLQLLPILFGIHKKERETFRDSSRPVFIMLRTRTCGLASSYSRGSTGFCNHIPSGPSSSSSSSFYEVVEGIWNWTFFSVAGVSHRRRTTTCCSQLVPHKKSSLPFVRRYYSGELCRLNIALALNILRVLTSNY